METRDRQDRSSSAELAEADPIVLWLLPESESESRGWGWPGGAAPGGGGQGGGDVGVVTGVW